MIRENITTDEIIHFLNELIQADQKAMTKILTTAVPCNDKLTNHPTVQGPYMIAVVLTCWKLAVACLG